MAQARDGGIIYSDFFARIHPRWNVPANAVLLAAVLETALAAIYVGNTTAYYGITSSLVVLQVFSYCAPVALGLFRRSKLKLTYGPWQLGRSRRTMVNAVAILWYAVIGVFMSLPTIRPVDASNM